MGGKGAIERGLECGTLEEADAIGLTTHKRNKQRQAFYKQTIGGANDKSRNGALFWELNSYSN